MKKITKEEFESYDKARSNPVIKALFELEVGEALSVDFSEWTGLGSLQSVVWSLQNRYNIEPKHRFKTKMQKEQKKWLFLRTE